MSTFPEWYVYLLVCKDQTYYCGIAKDVQKRLEQHNAGKGARYTRGRAPIELVWSTENALSHQSALRLERRIKAMKRSEKSTFVKNDVLQKSVLKGII